MPAQIRIEFDPPSPSTSLITSEELNHQEAESKFAESEVPAIEVRSPSPRQISNTSPVDDQTTSSASQGFLSIDSGVRLRSSSQDSHHSVPKSWSDFESEAKKWKVSLTDVRKFNPPPHGKQILPVKLGRELTQRIIQLWNLVTSSFDGMFERFPN